MNEFIQAAKQKLSSMICPIHHKTPDFIINGDSIELKNVCCNEFAENCNKEVKAAITESGINQIKNIFKQ